MKEFNRTGICVPSEHYMVDLTTKLKQIRRLVDRGDYFVINRGRQFGKSTVLFQLENFLQDDYVVISISFEGLGRECFNSERQFCQEFLGLIYESLEDMDEAYATTWLNDKVDSIPALNRHITKLCRNQKVVLMIDEVDQASNYQLFVDFLSMLRAKFLLRPKGRGATFQSVILAGVYDIKNIKLKMVHKGIHVLNVGEEQYNSPWNIAVPFNVEMAFSLEEIAGMLKQYSKETQVQMDVFQIANALYAYTSGYPVLISSLCKYMDEDLKKNWTIEGVEEAVNRLIREKDNVLFDSVSQNLENNKNVRELLHDYLIHGTSRNFTMDNPAINLAYRYNYIREVKGKVVIHNRILEIRLTSYFVSKLEAKDDSIQVTNGFVQEVTKDGKFNMELCLKRFALHWNEIYTEKERDFFETHCRLMFLTYLKPLLNGVGYAFIETSLTDSRRMDIVVIYNKQRFVIELKTWKGFAYHEQGLDQLVGYLHKVGEPKGYLLTFDFREKREPLEGVWRQMESKQIYEVRV